MTVITCDINEIFKQNSTKICIIRLAIFIPSKVSYSVLFNECFLLNIFSNFIFNVELSIILLVDLFGVNYAQQNYSLINFTIGIFLQYKAS